MNTTLTRRRIIQLVAATTAAPLLGICTADARAPFLNTGSPGWTRFRHGKFECTVVTDGPLPLPGDPRSGFPTADPTELGALLKSGFLPTDAITLDQNILVVNTASQLVLIDTGSGVNKALAGC